MGAEIYQLRPQGNGPDTETEGKFLGAVLELPERLEIVETSGLVPEDFRNPRASQTWKVLLVMLKLRLEITAATVVSRGERAQLLSSADRKWLEDLEHSNTLNKDQAIQIAEDIRVESRKRKYRGELQTQLDIVDRGRFSPSQASGALESMLHSLAVEFTGDETAASDLLELNVQWDDNVKKGQTMLRPTGIRVLDEILGGGVPRNLWIIQGKPGAGKNALLATMIRAKLVADPSCRIGLFGLESGTAWLSRRWQSDDLGVALSEIGSKALTPEQWERKAGVIDPAHQKLLDRVFVYRHGGAPAAELVRRAKRWIFKFQVTDLLIDNLREVKPDPRSRQDYHLQIADTISSFRDLGYKHGVSTGLLVHDTEAPRDHKPGEERPPHPDNMQGGKDPGAKARAVVGIYRIDNAYCASVTKNESGPAGWPYGPACEFQFQPNSATFNPEGGRILDLKTEAARKRREAKERGDEESVETQERRAAIKAKRKASAPAAKEEKPAELPAQAALLEVPATKKPEPEASS